MVFLSLRKYPFFYLTIFSHLCNRIFLQKAAKKTAAQNVQQFFLL